MSSYTLLIRPVNCSMIGFAVIVGAVLAGVRCLDSRWLSLVYGFITGFTLTAASMSINDYYDREIDAVNEPSRPIPSGSIRPKEALIFAFFLTFVGFLASYLTSTTFSCLLVAIIAWAVFVAYTTFGKRAGLIGNLLVSTCVAIPFIFGSIAFINAVGSNVLVFVFMVFLSNTGREITKGIVDVRGDKAHHVKTLAVRYGERCAATAASFFYLFAVALTPLPFLLDLVSFWFVPLVLITDIGLVWSSIILLRNCSRENARKVKKTILLWFVIGLLAFIVGIAGRANA